jgi:hypothetical protein
MDFRPLDELQKWFQAAVTHPGGVATATDDVAAIVLPSSQQSADERLGVYAQAYWARLLECLREEFPTLRAAIGDEAFDGLAVDYLIHYPSQSYTLAELGSRFADHLAATRPDDDFSAAAVELARLERTIGEVFDSPGGETLGYLTPEAAAAVPADRRADLRLLPLPTFVLLRFEYDVNSWFTRMRADPHDATRAERRPTFVALSRRQFIVRRHPLSEIQYDLLTELRGGSTLGRALTTLTDAHPTAVAEIAVSLGAWFAEWSAAGFFRNVTVR